MSFETDVSRIEEIAQKLNASDITLEQSLALFEEGMKLAKELEKTLEEAKRKVEIVLGEETDTVEITNLE
ncbi:MAG: exodeoxyribonuclease VII small subunit [Sphaerochaeta sp.]|jgi:exodeoxyribonuclease VII small subunit|uniref:exodeoxyribonuclease VII small subunit n=1 Tax=Sphaerochaeta sp. TaxID=1972642 RepID=UPI001DBD2231|nr:exodeoxyribonuclease VII small subunit [uncultured Sphaerochaeta sp.]MDD3056943.1 exodeoxyribonuclease VII small subunit [Sphaerochaeta sp.]MDD3928580.1 exodeoxyribonuclease VII small subunit [Sphaerochaeta sp.]NCC13300.1 exodeoxyribonuclease VII small subunit [Spirochaetia bacterium]NCC89679.1 exodeoxyribonuclease VII small subunit [Spirochaetia bacterium]